MEENSCPGKGGWPASTQSIQTNNKKSVDNGDLSESCLSNFVVDKNNDNSKVSSTAGFHLAELESNKNGACIIPGVEHVFFETELEKLEHHIQDRSHQIVVLAVDNSIPSEIAFKFYVDHVNRPGFVLHVVHHSNYLNSLQQHMDEGPSPRHCQEMMVKEDARVNEVEEKYRKLITDNQIVGEFIVLRGKDAWHDIIQYQEKVNGMMIVVGTRGHNSLRRTFMGSVSDSVVHHASCPVLVCCHPKN